MAPAAYGIAAARAVRAVRGFHLDDVGAEFAEDARREWARDERAKFQDFQPCQSRHDELTPKRYALPLKGRRRGLAKPAPRKASTLPLRGIAADWRSQLRAQSKRYALGRRRGLAKPAPRDLAGHVSSMRQAIDSWHCSSPCASTAGDVPGALALHQCPGDGAGVHVFKLAARRHARQPRDLQPALGQGPRPGSGRWSRPRR